MEKKKKFYFGWFVMLACSMLYFILIGLINNSTSHYIVPITEELGISRSAFMAKTIITQIVGVVMSIYVYKIFDKINYRILMPIGFTLYCAANFLNAQVKSIEEVFIIAFLQGFFSFPTSFVVLSTTISNWFIKNRGLVIAIVMSFSGLGGIVFNPLVAALIANFGWRVSYMIISAIMLAICLPFIIAFLYLKPEDKGLKPYGEKQELTGTETEKRGLLKKEALRTSNLWLSCAVMFLISFTIQGFLLNSAPIFREAGHDEMFTGFIGSISMISLIIGKFALGALFDRYGTRVSNSAYHLILAFGMAILLFRANPVLAAAGAGVVGIALALNTMAPPLMIPELFGEKDHGNIYAVMNVFLVAGSSLSSVAPGFIFDITGSYQLMIIIWSAMCVLAFLLMMFAVRWDKAVNKHIRKTRM